MMYWELKPRNSNQELNSYTTSENYGFDNKFICFAIVFTKYNSDNYEYSIRFNTSEVDYEVPSTLLPKTDELRE